MSSSKVTMCLTILCLFSHYFFIFILVFILTIFFRNFDKCKSKSLKWQVGVPAQVLEPAPHQHHDHVLHLHCRPPRCPGPRRSESSGLSTAGWLPTLRGSGRWRWTTIGWRCRWPPSRRLTPRRLYPSGTCMTRNWVRYVYSNICFKPPPNYDPKIFRLKKN